jgi:phosphohistidine phosphatase
MEKNRILSVLRHGEAEIGVGQAGDFSRNLSPFGKHQIGRLNQVLKNNDFKIEFLVSSPAIRACQTAELISKDFEPSEIKIEKDIYEAEPEDLIKIIHKVDEKIDNLLLVGHNPGISALISLITGEGYVSLRPGMMAIMDVYIDDWSLLGRESGILREIWQ